MLVDANIHTRCYFGSSTFGYLLENQIDFDYTVLTEAEIDCLEQTSLLDS